MKIEIDIHDDIYDHIVKQVEHDIKWYSKNNIIKAIIGNLFPLVAILIIYFVSYH